MSLLPVGGGMRVARELERDAVSLRGEHRPGMGHEIEKWRRERDSNPRWCYPRTLSRRVP